MSKLAGTRLLGSLPFLLLVALLAVGVSSCEVDLGEDHLLAGAGSPEAHEVCILPPPEGVMASGGPFSLRFDDRVIWVFGETFLVRPEKQDTLIVPSCLAVSAGRTLPCGAPLVLRQDGDYVALPAIPFTADELAYNGAHPGQPQLKLWPLSGLVSDEVGYVFYQKVLFTDYFHFTVLGVGISVVHADGRAERLVPGVWAQDPTLLWLAPQADWGQGAFSGDDGYAYVFGCCQRASDDRVCRIARVALADLDAPAAWEYRTGDGWSSRAEDSAVVFAGVGAVTATWLPPENRLVGLFTPPMSNEVRLLAAPEPWGPFQDEGRAFTGTAPEEWWIRDLHLHPGLTDGEGGGLLCSYYTDPGDGTAGTRFVRLALPGGMKP